MTCWCLPATDFLMTQCLVQVELARRYPVPSADSIRRKAMTMVPNLTRRLSERSALPFVGESHGVET
uniref:Uncharacterized protein n=1 Tax=Hyaloperonospora arabidopsidis (strain Emoy2) TaxID=559515 RepID=M4C3R9_HYAAE